MIIKTSESWKLKSTVWRSWRPFKTSIRASFSLIDRSETIGRSGGRFTGGSTDRPRLALWTKTTTPKMRPLTLQGKTMAPAKWLTFSFLALLLFVGEFGCVVLDSVRVLVCLCFCRSVRSPSVCIFLSETVYLSVYLLAALYVLFIVIIFSSLFPGFPSTIGANEK